MKQKIYDFILFMGICLGMGMLIIINILNIFVSGLISYNCKMEFIISNLGLLCSTVIGFGIIWYYLSNKIKIRLDSINNRKLMLVLSLFLFLSLLLISYHIAFIPGYDVTYIITDARNIAIGNKTELCNSYYSSYPNNLLLTGIYAVLYYITKSFVGIIIFQCVLFVVSGIIIFDLIFIYTKQWYLSWIGWCLYWILNGSSAYFCVPYSDSAGLIFPLLILWIYQKYRKTRQWIYIFFFALVSFLSYSIKPQVFIVSIAIMIIEILRVIVFFRWDKLKKYIVVGVLCVGLDYRRYRFIICCSYDGL